MTKSYISSTDKLKIRSRWLPILIGVFFFVTLLMLSWKLRDREQENLQNKISREAEHLATDIKIDFRNRVQFLESMVKRWELRKGIPKDEYINDVESILPIALGFQAVEWVDKDFFVRWIAPFKGNEKAQNLNLAFEENRRLTMEKARDTKLMAVSKPIDLVQGGKGFLVLFPIYFNGKFDGFILAVFEIHKWLDYIFGFDSKNSLSDKYNICIYFDDVLVYKNGDFVKQTDTIQATEVVKILDKNLSIYIEPSESFFKVDIATLPNITIFIGIFLSVLVALVVFLFQRAYIEAKRASIFNNVLEAKTALLNAQTNSIPEGILVISDNNKRLLMNKRFLDLFNPPKDIQDDQDDTAMLRYVTGLTKYPDQFLEKIKYINSQPNEISRDELELSNGMVLDRYSAPVKGEDGQYYGRIWVFNDITKRKKNENELREGKYRYQSLVSNLPGVIYRCLLDKNWTMLYISDAIEQLCGYQASDFINNTIHTYESVIHREDTEYVDRSIKECIEVGKAWNIEYRVLHKDGSIKWVNERGLGVKDENGKIVSLDGIILDITQRKNIEYELTKSEERMRCISDSTNDGIIMMDAMGKVSFWNPAAEIILGYTKSEAIGHDLHNLIAPKSFHKAHHAAFPSFLKTGTGAAVGKTIELKALKKSGEEIPVELSLSAIKMDNQWHSVGLIRNITERKNAENELKQISGRLSLAARAGGVGVWDYDIVNNKLVWDDRMFYLYGIKKEQFAGAYETWQSGLHTDDKIRANAEIQMAIKGEKEFNTEFRVLWPDGTIHYIRALALVERDVSGRPLHMIGTNWDITKSVTVEQILKRQLLNISAIFNNSPYLMWLKDTEGKFLSVNENFARSCGKDNAEEVIGLKDTDIWPADLASKYIKDDEQVMANKSRNIEEELVDDNGIRKWFETIKTPILDNKGVVFGTVGMARDITERKQIESDIKTQNDFYNIVTKISEKLIQTNASAIEEVINDALKTLGTFNNVDRSYIFEVDEAADEMTNTYEWCGNGITSEMINLQKLPFSLIQKWKDEYYQNRHIYIESVKDLPPERQSEKDILEPQSIKSLVTVPMYYGSSLLGFMGFDSVRSHKSWNVQVINLLKIVASVIAGVIAKKNTETLLQKAKDKADKASKSKSEFLANMSHEIRTPLNGVIGFTDLLKSTPLNDMQEQYVENAHVSAHSLLGIINDILDFSKIEAGKLEIESIKTDIIELVEQSSDIIKYHAAKKGLELLLNIQPDMPRYAMVDPVRLKQILVNLLSNAVKFTEHGEIELKVTFKPLPNNFGDFNFSVSDTGIGITPDQQKKLFKSFSQADNSITRKFGGTGLGLTISSLLALKMGNGIKLESEPGKGSVFSFTIEVQHEHGEKILYNELKEIKRTLVVDDNDKNRLILESILKNWGIEFISCDNGQSSIDLIDKDNPFDLIIMDYNMPNLNGLDTICMIREKLKSMPGYDPAIMLYTSIDTAQIRKKSEELGINITLPKPVKLTELLHYLKNIHSRQPNSEGKSLKLKIDSDIESISDKSPLILIAEDVTINMLLTTTLITKLIPNVKILEAQNGREAFEMVKASKPDIILMDIQMPEMDGIAATECIRKYESSQGCGRIPIIALTAGAIKGEGEKCKEAGMDEFLTKPIDKEILKEVLKKYFPATHKDKDLLQVEKNYADELTHFNKKKLIEKIDNDIALFEMLLDKVLQQTPGDIDAFGVAVRDNKLEQAKRIAHKIKGTSLNMCFEQLVLLSRKIEEGNHNDIEIFSKSHKDMLLEWNKIESIIRSI